MVIKKPNPFPFTYKKYGGDSMINKTGFLLREFKSSTKEDIHNYIWYSILNVIQQMFIISGDDQKKREIKYT